MLREVESESGQNDQKGFLKIFLGAFQGIRNPKAHSLDHDLTEQKAAQYLVFASLLARRVEEAERIEEPKLPSANAAVQGTAAPPPLRVLKT